MKRKINIPTLVNLSGVPIILIVLGLILIVSPDSATSLISRVLGWVLIGYGVFFGICAVVGLPSKRMGMLIGAAICLPIGVYLVRNPLFLAQGIGKFLGIMLGLRGIRGVWDALNVKKHGGSYIMGIVVNALTFGIGLWLLFSPLSPTRILMTIVGIVFVVIGVANLLNVKDEIKALISGEELNIIDADD